MLGKLRLNPRAHLTFCSSRNLNPYIVSCSVQTSPPSQSSTKPTGPEWNSSPATMHFGLIPFIAHSHKVLYYINLFLLLRKTFLNLILRLGTTPLHSLMDQHVVEAGYIGHLPCLWDCTANKYCTLNGFKQLSKIRVWGDSGSGKTCFLVQKWSFSFHCAYH